MATQICGFRYKNNIIKMALKNQDGNYLKIVDVFFNKSDNNVNITYHLYKTKDERIELSDFQIFKSIVYIVNNFILYFDGSISLDEQLIRDAYLTLKNNGFEDWIDV